MDLELTRDIQVRDIKGQLTFGARYVEFESSAFAHASDLFFPNDYLTISTFDLRHYDGTGFVGGLNGTKHIRGGWSLFWSGRGSGIFGSYYQKIVAVGGFDNNFARVEAVVDNSTTSTFTQNGGASQTRATAIAAADNNLWIFEGQLGLRYARQLTAIPAEAFLSIGLEYQHWNLPDAYTDATFFTGAGTLPAPVRSSSIDLTGINVAAGLNY